MQGPFVAGFAQSNLGDVSPNIMGARCIDTGLPCDFVTSSCNNRTQLCIAFGPGKDMVDSTRIIGERQYVKAKVCVFHHLLHGHINHLLVLLMQQEMFDKSDSDLEIVEGPVQFVHQYVDMPNYSVAFDDPVDGPKMVSVLQCNVMQSIKKKPQI
jgi:neutral ceramidase